jgi:hypothetical protein
MVTNALLDTARERIFPDTGHGVANSDARQAATISERRIWYCLNIITYVDN